MALKPTPIKYPLDCYPGTVKHEGAQHGLAALVDAATAINDALGKAQDVRVLGKAVKAKTAEALKVAQHAQWTTRAASESKAKLMKEAIAKRSEFEKETRDLIRAHKSPVTLIRQFIAAGDADAVGAVFRAPPYLTGLTDEQFGTLYQYAKQIITPDLYAQEQEADAAVARLGRAIEVFNKEAARLDTFISGSDEAIAAALVKPKEAAA